VKEIGNEHDALRFMSLLFTSLVTGSSLAHLLEVPNKIKLPVQTT
jgi:hypothetical protein